MPTLLCYYPDKEKRWKIELEQDRFTIGRSREVDVCIPHTSISKRHTLVERRGARYFFRDLGSKNGSYLNDFKKLRGILADGDELRLGSIRITFYGKSAPPKALEAHAGSALPGSGDEAAGTAAPGDVASRTTELQVAAVGENPGEEESVAPEEEAAAAPAADLERITAEDALPDADGAGEDGYDLVLSGIEEVEAPSRKSLRRAPRPRRVDPPARGDDIPAPRRIPVPVLVAASLAFIGLGFVLGHLASIIDEPNAPGDPPGAARAPEGAPVPEPARVTATPLPQAATGQSVEPSSPLGPPAAIEDPETRSRLIVRLHLDLLDRPPTRDELAELSSWAHDRLWHEVVTRARSGGLRLGEDAARIFSRFMGRTPGPGDVAALLDAAGKDLDHFAFMIGTSRDYASASHRRKRSAKQLMRSLIVDLLGVTPGRDDSAKVLGTMEDAKGAIAPVVKLLAGSEESRAGPREGDGAERWIEGAYGRLLLRRPTPDEKRRGLETIAAREGGWRDVLSDLAGRGEYLEY